MNKTVKIDGMMCGHCEKRVTGALIELGCTDIRIDLKSGVAKFVCDDSVCDAQIKDSVEALGFDVISID